MARVRYIMCMGIIASIAATFKIVFGLFNFFLTSLMPKKSSGKQKSYMWLVFDCKAFPKVIIQFSSLCK